MRKTNENFGSQQCIQLSAGCIAWLTWLGHVAWLTLLGYIAWLPVVGYVAWLTFLGHVVWQTSLGYVAWLILLAYIAWLTFLGYIAWLTSLGYVAWLISLGYVAWLIYSATEHSYYTRLPGMTIINRLHSIGNIIGYTEFPGLTPFSPSTTDQGGVRTMGPTSPVSPFSPEGPGRPCWQEHTHEPLLTGNELG
jgi:hypothetical protein